MKKTRQSKLYYLAQEISGDRPKVITVWIVSYPKRLKTHPLYQFRVLGKRRSTQKIMYYLVDRKRKVVTFRKGKRIERYYLLYRD